MKSRAKPEFVLYSDGGADSRLSAAGACIVENPVTGKRVRLFTYLGDATNNEGEICAGLVGLSLVVGLCQGGKSPVSHLRWVCDSEYVLRSATEYIHTWQRNGWRTANRQAVKNQGLWRAFLFLSSGLSILPEHVRGHSGHPENEECDAAVSWARENGAERLAEAGDGCDVELRFDGKKSKWKLFDGREIIEYLRQDSTAEVNYLRFAEALKRAGLIEFESPLDSRKEACGSKQLSFLQEHEDEPVLKRVVAILQKAREEALGISSRSPRAKELLNKVDKLLKETDSHTRRQQS